MSLLVDVKHHFADFDLDMALEIDRPGVTALFGPSGSGKTTTINAIAGLLRPDSGRIKINGQTVFESASGRFVPGHKRHVGYVFQDARLFPHLSVRGNLDFGARRAKVAPSRAERDRLIELLGIGHLLARRPGDLSAGERQRVALGRTVLSKPRVLLLDEPFSALDPTRKSELLPYFETMRDEAMVPIVHVSHSIDEVTRLADQMVVVNEGAVAAQGSVYDIMSRLDLFPLTGRFEAGALLLGRIVRHHARDHLTEVDVDKNRLWVPLVDAEPGQQVRLRIRARDVMLARSKPSTISANNILRGTVREIRTDEGAYTDVQLTCGGAKLLARVTHRSRRRLKLELGLTVYAVIKSATVDRRTATVEPE